MAEIRYDHREGPGKGIEVPVNHSYFHRKGGKFVIMTNGAASLAGSTALVSGWAVAGRDANSGLKDSVLVESGDVFMINGLADVFEMPVNESVASLAVTMIGEGAGIVLANESTYLTRQYAILGPTLSSPLSIVRVNLTQPRTVHVRIKPTALKPN